METPAAEELAAALDDLLTAVIRVGVRGARHAPSVDDALERVFRAAPKPTRPLRVHGPSRSKNLLLLQGLHSDLQAQSQEVPEDCGRATGQAGWGLLDEVLR